MDFSLRTLPGGAKLAVAPMPHHESVSVGVWLRVGGRNESVQQGGVSHFIEHLLFKGTRRRTSLQISEAVEGVGGYLNAFTAEEMTCYYAKAPARHLEMLLDVLLDMLSSSLFRAAEVERERGVICEEIRMYEDMPQQVAVEHLNALLWPGHALGRPLAGTLAGIAGMKRADILSYLRRHYHQGNLLLCVAGKTDEAEVLEALGDRLRKVPKGRAAAMRPFRGKSRKPQIHVVEKPIEQTHLALGFPAVSHHDPQRIPLRLLSVILGENMSSRLFQIIREEHGLAYSIDSAVNYFRDTGRFAISAGVENANATRALELVLRCLRDMVRKEPSADELHRSKEYLLGQLYLGLESSSNRLMWLGESLLNHGRVRDPDAVARRIQATTRADLRRAATDVLRLKRLCVTAVSPVVKAEEIAATVRRAM